jgi:hypothetical protein
MRVEGSRTASKCKSADDALSRCGWPPRCRRPRHVGSAGSRAGASWGVESTHKNRSNCQVSHHKGRKPVQRRCAGSSSEFRGDGPAPGSLTRWGSRTPGHGAPLAAGNGRCIGARRPPPAEAGEGPGAPLALELLWKGPAAGSSGQNGGRGRWAAGAARPSAARRGRRRRQGGLPFQFEAREGKVVCLKRRERSRFGEDVCSQPHQDPGPRDGAAVAAHQAGGVESHTHTT